MSITDQVFLLIFFFQFAFIFKIFFNEHFCGSKFDSQYLTPHENNLERNVRKKWLFSFMLMTFLCVALSFFTVIAEEGVQTVTEEIGIPAGITLSTLIIIPWFWITYHCSFKKRGTSWLAWSMIRIPLGEIVELFKGNFFEGWTVLSWYVFIFSLTIEAYYLFNCYQLRKVNARRMKVESDAYFLQSSECTNCVSKIENAQNLDDLDDAYAYSIRELPRWEKRFSSVYKLRKSQFLETC